MNTYFRMMAAAFLLAVPTLEAKQLKVLAIGNSFSLSMMQELPKAAAAYPDCELDIVNLMIGGCTLERHWSNVEKATADPAFRPYGVTSSYAFDKEIGAKLPKRANIPEMLKADRWDVVTIQQGSGSSTDYRKYQPFADKLIAKIRELAPQAEIRIQQTWSYSPYDGRLAKWKMTPDTMYEAVRDSYGRLASAHSLKVIPTGDAVQRYRQKLPVAYDKVLTKAEVAGLKEPATVDFHGDAVGSASWKDGKLKLDPSHLNAEGKYLQACVWLASLFDVDVTRLTYVPALPDFAKKAKLMRSCAMEAVKNVATLAVPAFVYQMAMPNADGVYAVGDKVPLTVTVVDKKGAKVVAGTVGYTFDNFGTRKFGEGKIDLAKTNPFTIVATRDNPGIVRLTLKAKGEKDFHWGVAFSPEKIRTGSSRPADFDAFWADAKAKYDREVPVDVKLEKLDRYSDEKQTAYRLSLTTPHGKTVDGVLTEPADLTKGPYPVRLSVPGAGPSTGCPVAADGKIRLTMNVHFYPLVVGEHKHSKGNAKLLEQEKAEVEACKTKYRVNRYCLAGVAVSREEYHYYDCILAISRALDWLWARPEVKKDDFRYAGTSQGGGFGLILTGFNSHITKTVAYVPAMTDMLGCQDDNRQSGWPQPLVGHPADLRDGVMKNAPYFDAAHFAARIRTPIRVAVGLSDTVCAPGAVWAGYNAIPSADKDILPTPGMGHKVDPKVYKTLGDWLEK